MTPTTRVRLAALVLLTGTILALLAPAVRAEATPNAPAVFDRSASRFVAVNLFVDAGATPLAAYQIEFDWPAATLVGVEGGDHAAYADPPFHDPKALAGGGRVIVAAFSTAADLPAGRTRVARLHLRAPANAELPADAARLAVAGDPRGERIAATVEALFPAPLAGDAP